MKSLFGTFVLFALVSAPVLASTVTIDFEEADRALIRNTQDPDACINDLTVSYDGYTFANPGLCGAHYEYNDGFGTSIGLYYAATGSQQGAELIMTRNDGQNFDFLGLDMLRGASNYMNIAGYRDGQLLHDVRLVVSGFIQGHYLNWFDLDTVVFYKTTNAPNSIGIDNLEVTAVPIPAAVWLFASGLGLLGWLRRGTHSS